MSSPKIACSCGGAPGAEHSVPYCPYALWDAKKTNGARIPEGVLRFPISDRHAAAALDGEAKLVREAQVGVRNHTLNVAAYNLGQLVALGTLSEALVRDELTRAAQLCGLEAGETSATITSGLKAGMEHPRQVPELQPRAAVNGSDPLAPGYVNPGVPLPIPEATPEHQPPPVERTSWWPRDLGPVLAGQQNEPEPTHLWRTDGRALMYSGRVNGLIGESESGKTWVALLAVLQALQDQQNVLYLDFEDSAAGIIGRLRHLGATDTHLAAFSYMDPAEALGATQQADLTATLREHQPQLIITDGYNAAMSLLGLDLHSNTDATRFAQTLLKPLSFTGAAVIYIDHLPKNPEQQMKGGIGAQAKRAMTTGCAIKVEVTKEFGRGTEGRLRLSVDKDRAGHVRGISAGRGHVGMVNIASGTNGDIQIDIQAPNLHSANFDTEHEQWRPTGLMEKISRYLESIEGDGISGNAIRQAKLGKNEYIDQALNALVHDGHVSRSAGSRGAILHKSIRPFREM